MNDVGLTEEQIERFDDITQRIIIDLRNRIAALEEQKAVLAEEIRDTMNYIIEGVAHRDE